MKFFRIPLTVLMVLTMFGCAQAGPETVRVATYNIRFLNADIDRGRRANIRQVIDELDADVIGLQEIKDRKALERIFDSSQWTLLIDDDSGDDQDLALAVRRPLRLVNTSADLDADDEHFLFPHSSDNYLFPNRRDVLIGEIQTPQGVPFVVFVVHAKSRVNGRNTTEERRVGASRALLGKLQRGYANRHFVLLGDFNDNPDDRSMNILETGDPNARMEIENRRGGFAQNLTELLAAQGHVTLGRSARDRVGGRINTIDRQSRERNFKLHGRDDHTGDGLFDQLLVSPSMGAHYRDQSVRVFDGFAALEASDHLPVYADFSFGRSDAPAPMNEPDAPGVIWISGLVPNPAGVDEGHEVVYLTNETGKKIDLAGWSLRDAGSNVYRLTGRIGSGDRLKIVMESNEMPLNNGGDTVELIDATGRVRATARYSKSDATNDNTIWFSP